ncbi:dTDP-4-dehydrorhamnose 3,5-epimerase [Planktomarina temperata]|nr:dTDP-4-dehydrorhamnose 3,5-epimerase [Planktomarina temperata]
MKVIDTAIKDVKIIEPTVYEDERGFFFESFNQREFEEAIGRKVEFVQDNQSKSKLNVVRGLHYQLPPFEQAKLVRVVLGTIFDVAVDLRKNSQTYGSWVGVELTDKNKRQLWIPEGFAHGFMTTSHTAEVLYKTNNYYSPAHDRAIRWDDCTLSIQWPEKSLAKLSQKDAEAPSFTY